MLLPFPRLSKCFILLKMLKLCLPSIFFILFFYFFIFIYLFFLHCHYFIDTQKILFGKLQSINNILNQYEEQFNYLFIVTVNLNYFVDVIKIFYQIYHTKKKSYKLIGQEYFGVITQNSMIFFVASMEEKINLITHIVFIFFRFKHLVI